MTDRELLEKAAKVVGNGAQWFAGLGMGIDVGDPIPTLWNPLTDDGDALRLAVKLKLLISVCPYHTEVRWYDEALSETHTIEQWGNSMTPEQWTRLAIVRAAVAMAENAVA